MMIVTLLSCCVFHHVLLKLLFSNAFFPFHFPFWTVFQWTKNVLYSLLLLGWLSLLAVLFCGVLELSARRRKKARYHFLVIRTLPFIICKCKLIFVVDFGWPLVISGHVVGLVNLGHTCFLNTLLQGLASCPTVLDWLLEHKDVNEESLVSALRTVLLGK